MSCKQSLLVMIAQIIGPQDIDQVGLLRDRVQDGRFLLFQHYFQKIELEKRARDACTSEGLACRSRMVEKLRHVLSGSRETTPQVTSVDNGGYPISAEDNDHDI